MPALARKTAPDFYDQRSVTVTRGVQAPPRAKSSARSGVAPRRSTARGVEVATSPETPSNEEVRELLSHFGHGSAEQEAAMRAQLDAQREAKRRARRRHRPFRLSFLAGVLAAAPLFLLASLLWLRSNALALSRYDTKLQDKISAARFDLERTRKEIAALNASPHIEQWAKERGWHQAGQNDFDQVPVPQTSPKQSDERQLNEGQLDNE